MEVWRTMKKIVTAVLGMFASVMLYAAENNSGIGFRGAFGIPAGTTLTDFNSDASIALFRGIDFGFSVFGNICFDSVPGLVIQPEIGYNYNKIGMKSSGARGHLSYSSLELPVLLGYTFETGNFLITPELGPYISIPLGKMNVDPGIGGTVNMTIDTKVAFGTAFGVDFGYKVSDFGVFNIDLRYITDFNKMRLTYRDLGIKNEPYFTRRELLLGLGFMYRFGR